MKNSTKQIKKILDVWPDAKILVTTTDQSIIDDLKLHGIKGTHRPREPEQTPKKLDIKPRFLT